MSYDNSTNKELDDDNSSLDTEILLSLKEIDDGVFLSEIINIFLKTAEVVRTELKTAIEQTDRSQIRSLAHKLKGSSRNLGANILGNICERLELGASDLSVKELHSYYKNIEIQYQFASCDLKKKWQK